ncbi:MAG TPA: cytochrome c oxidase assembly protein [Devosia sp.]|nr:cytochrome c oxidase assembly protein [Devosia sp.]
MDIASAFSFDMSYCGPPPSPDTLWGRWNFDPVLLAGLLCVLGLAAFALRGAEPRRQLAFGGAWGIAALLFISPICALTVALFSARVGHHIVLTMVAAPLLAFALPVRWRHGANLLPALSVSTMALWLWHVPDFYASAFMHPALYWAMQLSLLSSFVWLWLGLLRSPNPLAAGVTALASATQMGLLGALLVFAPQPLYLPHLATTLAFGLSPVDDQQLGGLIMWVPANLPLLAVVLWRLVDVLQPDRSAAR